MKKIIISALLFLNVQTFFASVSLETGSEAPLLLLGFTSMDDAALWMKLRAKLAQFVQNLNMPGIATGNPNLDKAARISAVIQEITVGIASATPIGPIVSLISGVGKMVENFVGGIERQKAINKLKNKIISVKHGMPNFELESGQKGSIDFDGLKQKGTPFQIKTPNDFNPPPYRARHGKPYPVAFFLVFAPPTIHALQEKQMTLVDILWVPQEANIAIATAFDRSTGKLIQGHRYNGWAFAGNEYVQKRKAYNRAMSIIKKYSQAYAEIRAERAGATALSTCLIPGQCK